MAKKAKKRPAPKKKSSPSKAKKGAAVNKVVRIKYRCQTTCRATPKFAHMDPGDVVSMAAVNTDVTLTFATSPFLTGVTVIAIRSGDIHYEEVKPTAAGHYPYTPACANCATLLGPPEMIVP